MLPGRTRRSRAGDRHLDLLAGALAVADDLQRKRLQHLAQAALEGGKPGVLDRIDPRRAAPFGCAGREEQQRIAGRRVAVDGDRVERLADAAGEQRLQHGAAIGASVATKDSIVAMSGAIMPAPLAMPLMVTSASPSFTVTVATFG